MKQFDYKKAWYEMALPDYEALPSEIRALVSLVRDRATWHQSTDLTMPWPNEVDINIHPQVSYQPVANLQQLFEEIDSEQLAKAALVVYFFGHWGEPPNNYIQHNGAYWKFAHFADQTLRKRLGLTRNTFGGYGYNFDVCEGCLRLYFSSAMTSTYMNIGWGTQEVYDRAHTIFQNNLGNFFGLIKNGCPTDAMFDRYNDIEKYMVEQ